MLIVLGRATADVAASGRGEVRGRQPIDAGRADARGAPARLRLVDDRDSQVWLHIPYLCVLC